MAGYVAWRLTLARKGLLLTGLLGGVVSSTATTLVTARQVRAATQSATSALAVILLANVAMLVRVLVIIAIVAPGLLWLGACALTPAALLALPIALWRLKQGADETRSADGYRNPTNLLTAIAFGAFYAAILILGAWLSDVVGARGMYALAAISGVTDVDAITLSSLRLFNTGALERQVAVTTIGVGVSANLLLKSMIVFVVGGRRIGIETALAFLPSLLALAGGLALLGALA
jgi:uncharacterized membrane protein (DUF4010 family)